jgi:large repetitive protein
MACHYLVLLNTTRNRLYKLFLCLFCSLPAHLISTDVQASHAAGAELTYKWVSDSTYIFYAKFYRDCSGVSEPLSFTMCIRNTCTNFSTSITLSKMTSLPNGGANGTSVSTGCPGNQTTCNGGSVIGFKEWWYSGTYTLPSRCTSWRFSISECCRNSAITNLSSPGSRDIYIDAFLNNVAVQNNSSPQFTNVPVPYVCTNQPFSYNNGTVESNGDSLVFTSIQPREGTCSSTPTLVPYTNVTYNPTNNPFNTGNTFSCDPNTGTMSFTATGIQSVVTSIRCDEYRNGVLIGSVMRDVQMIIRNCTTPVPNQTLLTNTINNAVFDTVTGFVTQGCYNATPITFCFSVTSANVNAVLIPTDNHGIALPGSTVTYTGLGTDSVIGCFTWTPTLADTGLSIIVVNIKDSTCTVSSPFIVTNSLTIPIYIGNYVGLDSLNIANVVDCTVPNTGGITANVSTTVSTLSYSLSPGAFANTTGVFTSLPIGTYTLSVSDGSACTLTSIVNIAAPNAPQFDSAMVLAPKCGLNNGHITAHALSPNASLLTYTLLPNGTANGNAVFSNISAGVYTIVASDAFLCTGSTTVNVIAKIPPSITGTLSLVSCSGGFATITAVPSSGISVPFMYNINGGAYQSIDSFTGIPAGTYTIGVVDADTCYATAVVTVVPPNPIVFANVVLTNPNCIPNNNGAVSLGASGGSGTISYSLDNITYQTSSNFSGLMGTTYTVYARDANGCTASTTLALQSPVPPVFISAATSLATCGLAVGTVTLVVTGGNGVLTYSIASPLQTSSTNVFTGLLPATYTLTAADALGCTTSSVSIISATPVPQISSILSTPATCSNTNGTIIVTASGGAGTLQYSNGGVFGLANNFSGLGLPNYTITVQDVNGCTSTSNVTIISAPGPVISVSALPIVCNNGVITIATTVLFGNSYPMLYAIDAGAFQSGSTFVASAGNHTISVKDTNNCIATATIALANPPALVINTIISTIPTCIPGSDAVVSVNASGGTGSLQYQLYSYAAQASSNIAGVDVGTYTVIVTDANGCTTTSVTSVAVPPAVVAQGAVVTSDYCLKTNGSISASFAGGTPTFNYSINGANYGNNGGLFTNLASGNYTVVASDIKGCTSTVVANVSAVAGPVISTVLASNNTCNLSNGSLTIVANSPGAIVSYDIGAFNNSLGNFNGLTGSTYTITVTDVNLCSVTSVANILDAPAPVVALNANLIACHNGTTSINVNLVSGASLPILYTLNGGSGQSAAIFSNVSSGNYTIVATDTNGCSGSASVNLANPQPLVISGTTYTTPSCIPGADGTLLIAVSGGASPYIYQLNAGTPQSSSTFLGLVAGVYNVLATDAKGCTVGQSVTIDNPLPPTILSWLSSTETCVPGTDATLQLAASGGFGGLTYSITNGTNYQSSTAFSGLNSGTYTIVVSDAKNCTASDIAVVQYAAAVILIVDNVQNIACFGASNGVIEVSASNGTGAYAYKNTNTGVTNATGIFTNLLAATYTIEASDSAGCTAQSIVDITEPPILSFDSTIANHILCNGNPSGSINVGASGGSGALLYSLQPNNFSQVGTGLFANLASGAYTISVVDVSACSISTVLAITQPILQTLTGVSTVNPSCFGGTNGSATTFAVGGTTPYTFYFAGDTNYNGQFTGLSSGVYTLLCVDAQNCAVSAVVALTNPSPIAIQSASASGTICNGDNSGSASISAAGGTGNITYQVLPNGASSASGNIGGLTAGVYTIGAIDSKGCSASAIIQIVDAPAIQISGLVIVKPICPQVSSGSIKITATGGTAPYSYAIGNGAYTQSSTFNNLIADIYLVHIKDALGCIKDTQISVQPINYFTLTTTMATSPLCLNVNGGAISISVAGTLDSGYYFELLPPATGNYTGAFTNLAAGLYTIAVRDINGCEITTVVGLAAPVNTVTPQITATQIICSFGLTQGTATVSVTGGLPPYKYLWDRETTDTLNTIEELASGFYTATVTDFNGCVANDTVTIFDAPCCEVAFPNGFTPDGDGLNDNFKPLTSATAMNVSFLIYDRWGNQVFATSNPTEAWNGTYKSAACDFGTYFYVYKYFCSYGEKWYSQSGDITLFR